MESRFEKTSAGKKRTWRSWKRIRRRKRSFWSYAHGQVSQGEKTVKIPNGFCGLISTAC